MSFFNLSYNGPQDGFREWVAALGGKKVRDISIGVGVVAVDDGKFYVTRRSADCKTGAGIIALPGGYIEEGEAAQKASVRELLEETGLIGVPIFIDHHRYVITLEERFTEGHIISLYVACRVVGGTLENKETDKHGPWGLITLDDAWKMSVAGYPHWLPLGAMRHYQHQIGLK